MPLGLKDLSADEKEVRGSPSATFLTIAALHQLCQFANQTPHSVQGRRSRGSPKDIALGSPEPWRLWTGVPNPADQQAARHQ